MDIVTARSLVSQLAEDFGWLEQYCRQQPEQAPTAGQLRIAAALVRNCIGPLLDGQDPPPLHAVVVGGAGAGKSTVANFLSGAPAAEANPQAGFTRHPIAYTSTNGPLNWAGHFGFLGPLQRLSQPSPSSLDRDVYQVRRVPADPTSFDLLKDWVVWDCPDMTTWAAAGYIPRLLEVAGLGDVIVYVASDERYNDEVPTQFLGLLLQTGKPVIVCLTKMNEADASALIGHFQKEVLSHLPGGVVGCLAIPYLTPAQVADPNRLAPRYRIPLLNQVAVLGGSPAAARRRTVLSAMNYLMQRQDQLLGFARNDLAALQGWQALVQTGQREFENRYQREYLTSENFRGFDEALVRLMDLLELPGLGKVLSGALWVLRTPYRLFRGLISKAMSRPSSAHRPEEPVLQEAFTGWIDMLRKEAAHRSHSHPLWQHIAQGFHSGGLADRSRERYQQDLRKFQMGLASEVDRTARAIYEELEKNPAMLNTLRGSKFALDVAAIAGTIAAGGINWHDFILVPLVASLTHQLVELLGKGYVDAQREQTRMRQQQLLVEYLSGPLAQWLTQWPSTGGSSFERLQLALRRIPQTLQEVNAMVRAKCAPVS
jgi:hypothetical protein